MNKGVIYCIGLGALILQTAIFCIATEPGKDSSFAARGDDGAVGKGADGGIGKGIVHFGKGGGQTYLTDEVAKTPHMAPFKDLNA